MNVMSKYRLRPTRAAAGAGHGHRPGRDPAAWRRCRSRLVEAFLLAAQEELGLTLLAGAERDYVVARPELTIGTRADDRMTFGCGRAWCWSTSADRPAVFSTRSAPGGSLMVPVTLWTVSSRAGRAVGDEQLRGENA